ncbi:MAG TPA: hypothetical protein DIS76_04465 [Rhodospirillaceae bacterium]|nr:hypothetical protein [Rhodospirillaceae bacterium]
MQKIIIQSIGYMVTPEQAEIFGTLREHAGAIKNTLTNGFKVGSDLHIAADFLGRELERDIETAAIKGDWGVLQSWRNQINEDAYPPEIPAAWLKTSMRRIAENRGTDSLVPGTVNEQMGMLHRMDALLSDTNKGPWLAKRFGGEENLKGAQACIKDAIVKGPYHPADKLLKTMEGQAIPK